MVRNNPAQQAIPLRLLEDGIEELGDETVYISPIRRMAEAPWISRVQ